MVKAVNGKSVPILLRSGWTIADVKRYLSPELGIEQVGHIFSNKTWGGLILKLQQQVILHLF